MFDPFESLVDNPVYRQCTLERPSKQGGVERTVSYLPLQKLSIGEEVRFRNSAQEPWSEGWIVVQMAEPTDGRLVEEVINTSWARTRTFSDR